MSSLIIAAIVVGLTIFICLLLVLIHNNQKRKKMNQLLEHFNACCAKYKLTLSSQEVLIDSILGLDGPGKKILIVNRNPGGAFQDIMIALAEVKNCSVRKTYGAIGLGELRKTKLNEYLNKIALQFEFANQRPPIEFSFYNHVEHSIYQVAELEQKARHWELII